MNRKCLKSDREQRMAAESKKILFVYIREIRGSKMTSHLTHQQSAEAVTLGLGRCGGDGSEWKCPRPDWKGFRFRRRVRG